MNVLKRLLTIGAVLLLAACGGGGGSSGTTPFNPGAGGSPGTPTNPGTPTPPPPEPSLTLGLSATTISAATPGVVTATLLDAQRQPVSGQVVTFSVVRALAQTNVATALTDPQGRAVVNISPAATAVAGADEVQASVAFAGRTLTAISGFQVQSTNVGIDEFSAPGTGILSAGGETTLTLRVSGASVGSPVSINITSPCVTQGRATLSPGTLTLTSLQATVRYRDNGCGSLAQSPATSFGDQLQATVVGGTATRSLTLNVARPDAANIIFDSAAPEIIYLRGSGFVETSIVRFRVLDLNGNPLPRQAVTLTLLTSAAGLTVVNNSGATVGANVPIVRPTDDAGLVDLRVNAGTVPTPVRIEAAVQVPDGAGVRTVKTVSSALSVAVGLPSQLNFSLSQGTKNIEGYNIDGTPNTYQILAADRSGNPVPDGTSINFVAEGGQVQAVRQTELDGNGIARAVANFVSQEPRPADGRVTITVYALGEESFVDLNGNNEYDPPGSLQLPAGAVRNAGEPFQDLGNVFKDRRYNGVYNADVDEFIQLPISNLGACRTVSGDFPGYVGILGLDASIPSIPNTCDGRQWSGAGRVYVRRAVETVLSTSAARPLWASRSGLTESCLNSTIELQIGPEFNQLGTFVLAGGDTWYGGTSGSLSFIVADANPGNPAIGQRPRLNPMAAGTVITAATPTPGLSVSVGGGSPVPSTTEASGASVFYTFTDPNVAEAVVLVTFRSPSGLGTTIGVTVVRGQAAPSSCPL